MSSTLPKLIQSYKKWIIANPHVLTDIESTIRCLSYFTAGQFSNSSFASELIYTLPNLLVLFNDLLLYSGKKLHIKLHEFESKIKVWLTVVEYTETMLEVSAKRIWGQKGKWIIVTIIQIFKTVLRLSLVHIYKERVTKSPPLQPINRDKLGESLDEKSEDPEGFKLKRSGTVVRMVRSSHPIASRTWEPLTPSVENPTKKLLLAESLYILKPLMHLASVSVSGEKQWPPWLLSLAVDLISLRLYKTESKSVSLSPEEQKELFRRRLSLLLYILRSPFYDTYSRKRIFAVLNSLSSKVPLARLLAEPLKKYLPHWQGMYFYMWSS